MLGSSRGRLPSGTLEAVGAVGPEHDDSSASVVPAGELCQQLLHSPADEASQLELLRSAYRSYAAAPLLFSGGFEKWPLCRDDLPESPLERAVRMVGEHRVEANRLVYSRQGELAHAEAVRLPFAEFVQRAAEAQGRAPCSWYLQWRDLPHPPAAEEAADVAGIASVAVSRAAVEACASTSAHADANATDVDGGASAFGPASAIGQLRGCSGSSHVLQDGSGFSAAFHGSAAAHRLASGCRRPAFVSAAALSQVNAWVGCSRTSHLHFDGLDNLLCVVQGAKEVHLYAPSELPRLFPQRNFGARWKSAAMSRLYTHYAEFASLRSVPFLKAEVSTGDMLYIPAGWWHEVLTPTLTMAFNFWFKPHPISRLRPTLLFLHSDSYASRILSRTEGDARGAEAHRRAVAGAGSAGCDSSPEADLVLHSRGAVASVPALL